ncbi:hypothetical protein SUNI508_04762 [Seiridium unicorne]|uniref:Uncharacterized protein n=1 Tax=Seiridium unicorne TaxID=138068 RepID=A0ABR2V6L5_9PEZI
MQQICSYPTVYACYETPQTLLAIGKGSAWSRHGPVFGSLQEDRLASSEPADDIGNDCIFTSGHVRIGDRHLVNTCKSGQPFSACPQENCWRKGIDAVTEDTSPSRVTKLFTKLFTARPISNVVLVMKDQFCFRPYLSKKTKHLGARRLSRAYLCPFLGPTFRQRPSDCGKASREPSLGSLQQTSPGRTGLVGHDQDFLSNRNRPNATTPAGALRPGVGEAKHCDGGYLDPLTRLLIYFC